MAPTADRTTTRRPGRRLIVSIGVLALVCSAVGGWLIARGAGSDTRAARGVADTFVSDLESSDYTGAYRLLASDTRATVSPEEFARAIVAQPRRVRSHTIDGVNSSVAHPRGYVGVFLRVTFTNGVVSPYDLLIVRQAGHWRVRGVPFWGISSFASE